MKKTISLVMMILMCISFVACGSKDIETTSVFTNYSEETSEDQNQEETEIPEETDDSESTTWTVDEYVDEFEQPTGEKFIETYVLDGKFSNSATTDSTLHAIVQVTKDEAAFMLIEYGSSLVKGTFDNNNYDISVLQEDGTKSTFRGNMYQGGTRIYFIYDDEESQFISLLKSGQDLKIYMIEDSDYSNSSYLFDVKTAGFAELYSQTF